MTTTIHVAHSPDSDDAFMFYALAEGKIDTGDLRYVHELSDIESLNRRALTGDLEVTAVSIHAYAYLHRTYALLNSGSSMGDRYGPRLVSKTARPTDPRSALRGLRIGVPGKLTTAYLTLKLYQPEFVEVVLPFDTIEDAVLRGEVDVGLLIHEGQLTFADRGLHLWTDLGEWWYEDTGLPPPPWRQCRAARSRPSSHSAGGPGSQGEHRLCSRTPRPGLGARQPVQPRNRRRANRPVRRDVREPLDRGLRGQGAGGGACPARPGLVCRTRPGKSRCGVCVAFQLDDTGYILRGLRFSGPAGPDRRRHGALVRRANQHTRGG